MMTTRARVQPSASAPGLGFTDGRAEMREPDSPEHAVRPIDSRWWRRRWIAPAVLALLPALVFLRVALLQGVFYAWDIQAYFYPYHVLPAAMLKHGEWPLWNPFTFSGLPLFGDGQTALLYPPNWLFFVLPGGAALSFSILLQFSIAGVGMYLLLRSLGLRRLPAFLGAAIYMFCGCLAARVVHLSILSGAALLPLAVLCVESAFRAWRPREADGTDGPSAAPGFRAVGRSAVRWAVLAAAVIAAQVFAGHPQVPVYTALALGLYAVLRGIERWRAEGNWTWLCRLPALVAGVYVLGCGLAAIQLVPWAELGATSTRAAGVSFDQVFGSSTARSDWLLQLFPYLYGALKTGPFADQPISISLSVRFLEHSAYVGILPLGLAVFALLGLRRRAEAERTDPSPFYPVMFLALLAVLGLLLAAGWATPLAQLVYRTPVIGRLRAVERALVLFDFAAAGLAAFGLQRLTGRAWSSRRYSRWSLAVIGAGTAGLPIAVVALASHAWFQRALNLPPEAVANLQPHRLNAAVPLLLAVASAAFLLWWSRRPATRLTQTLATVLILLDLGTYAACFNPMAGSDFYGRRPDVLAAFRDEPRPFRKATFLARHHVDDHTPLATLGLSWGMVFGVEDINGFNSLQSRRYTDYLAGPDEGDVTYGLLEDDRLLRPESPILSSLNVRYVLVPAGMPLRIGASYRRVYANPDVLVYENTLAYPRAFFAESVRGVTDASAVRRAVTADGFDGRRLALVESEQAPELPAPEGQDRVTVADWDANRISLASDAATPRFLVLSEMYSPGWHAKVDGAETAIYRTNYLFRGVVVPAGRHTVTFVYRPLSVLIGAGVSALALAAAALLILAGRRRGIRSASTPPDAGN
jgi:hypothetical protein